MYYIKVQTLSTDVFQKRARRKVVKMKKAGVKALRRNEWEIGELKEGKVYMPKNKKLRLEVI